jgi:multicomponent Na+:H+ antiporter subunit B
MTSLIFTTASRYLFPMLLLFAAFLLLRGHNMPGGGFAGGLIAAAGFSLHGFAYGMKSARRHLPVHPAALIGGGLLLCLGSGFFGPFLGKPFLTGQWGDLTLPGPGEWRIGTPFFFDVGVFLVVLGALLTIIFGLGEED